MRLHLLSLFKPEYVYHPRQVLRRIRLTSRQLAKDACCVRLPWGLLLEVNPHELIGNCVARLGVYDLTVSESLWRLLDPGETAVDAGSNIGYTASILALRAGADGQVLCFEPHPQVFARLERNIARWGLPVSARNLALSEAEGEAVLRVPHYFSQNQGTASLAAPHGTDGQEITVRCVPLDAVAEANRPIGILKVDVEGHELAVFQGAAMRLAEGAIRDIVFEDHGAYPTPAMQFLQRRGYRLFALRHRFTGPYLADVDAGREGAEPPSYLATLDAPRALARFAASGWSVLRRRGPRR